MINRKFFKKVGIISLCIIIYSGAFAAGSIKAKVANAEESEQQSTATTGGEVAKVTNYIIPTKEQIISTINPGLDASYGNAAPINQFWGTDGNYHIVYSQKDTVYISVLNQQLELQKTLEIPKDLPIVGNAVQDSQGNYYIVYGKYDTADANTDSSAGTAVVMKIIQYNKDGNKLAGLSYTGNDTGGITWGTKEPFNFGECDLLIDSSGILICRYGRVMYCGHQSSHTLYVDTATMSKLEHESPYNSHSFNQKVIETSDGGYLFADRGDGFDRGFVVFKMFKNSNKITSFIPFHFRNGEIYQTTYATLGGIAECSNGYAISGVSEKTLSYNKAENSEFNESRNVFVQVFSKNFTSGSSNQPNVQLLNGETRKAEGTYVEGTGNCESGASDYGVLWLTNYSGNIYASSPKMINIGNDQLLIMWEKKDFKVNSYYEEDSDDEDYYDYEDDSDYDDDLEDEETSDFGYYPDYNYSSNQYIESCYMVISGDGSVIIPETTIQDVHLSEFGEPIFKDGCIYWTTCDGKNKNLEVHRLAVHETMPAKVHVASIKAENNTIMAAAGEQVQIKVIVSPENADNKNLRYEHYDKDLIAVDENGLITVKDTGSCSLKIVSEDNKNVIARITVNATDSAPKNLKAVQVAPYYEDYRVKLSWKKSLYGDSYKIYRSTTKDKGYKIIDTTDELYYYDDSVKSNKTYYYKVKAYNDCWDDKNLNPYSEAVVIYVLEQPQNIKVNKASKTSAEITWSKSKDASGYEIYSYDKKVKKYMLLKTCNGNTSQSLIESNLSIGQTYLFKVRTFKTIDGINYYSNFSESGKIRM